MYCSISRAVVRGCSLRLFTYKFHSDVCSIERHSSTIVICYFQVYEEWVGQLMVLDRPGLSYFFTVLLLHASSTITKRCCVSSSAEDFWGSWVSHSVRECSRLYSLPFQCPDYISIILRKCHSTRRSVELKAKRLTFPRRFKVDAATCLLLKSGLTFV